MEHANSNYYHYSHFTWWNFWVLRNNDLPKSTFHVYGRTKNENRIQVSLTRASATLDSRDLPDQVSLAD